MMAPELMIAFTAGLTLIIGAAAAVTKKLIDASGDSIVTHIRTRAERRIRDLEASARRTLLLNAILQEYSQKLGAASSVLLEWEETDSGGEATVIAEWAGVMPASAPRYHHAELGLDYKNDVIVPLRNAKWLFIVSSELTEQSDLSDHYEKIGATSSWVHLLLDDGETVTYISTRFITAPTVTEAYLRSELRLMASEIKIVLGREDG